MFAEWSILNTPPPHISHCSCVRAAPQRRSSLRGAAAKAAGARGTAGGADRPRRPPTNPPTQPSRAALLCCVCCFLPSLPHRLLYRAYLHHPGQNHPHLFVTHDVVSASMVVSPREGSRFGQVTEVHFSGKTRQKPKWQVMAKRPEMIESS